MATNPDERLLATIGMMDATAGEHDGEAVAAFRAATRMLKAQGLTWAEIAKRALGPAAPSVPAPGSPRAHAHAQGFGDIFDGIFAETFAAARRPQTPPQPRAPSRLHGADVPAMIDGIVRVVDADRTARTGPMLVLEIIGDDTIFGPLVCFSAAVQSDLRAALADGLRVMARIQPPRTEGQMPVVTSATVMAG